ncbi:uracil-DNA glycosylase [Rickettsiales bacterium LUAb2]
MNLENTNLILELLEDIGVYYFVGNDKSHYYGKNLASISSDNLIKESNSTYLNHDRNHNREIVNKPFTSNLVNKAPETSNYNFNNVQQVGEVKVVAKNQIIKQITEQLKNINTMDELKAMLNNFKECSLAKTATNTVFGVGNWGAEVLMIGEAPGAEEDLQGEPFVGRSGKLLMKAIESVGIKRSNIFITNSIFWRPPGNRNPTEEEVAICKPFLDKIISLIKPKIILTVGKVAANMLLNQEVAIGKLRGKWYTESFGEQNNLVNNIKVKVLYHPAYLLRNPKQKKVFWFDLLELSSKIEELGIKV